MALPEVGEEGRTRKRAGPKGSCERGCELPRLGISARRASPSTFPVLRFPMQPPDQCDTSGL
eukprot:5541434-Alexandrium_andersonii.AAC.1